jgi:hypothetical protein
MASSSSRGFNSSPAESSSSRPYHTEVTDEDDTNDLLATDPLGIDLGQGYVLPDFAFPVANKYTGYPSN